MNISTDYGFQFKKIIHLLSVIDSEISIDTYKYGTVVLSVINRQYSFKVQVHLDEIFFFSSSNFKFRCQRQILLDVFIWLHLLQNVGVKDAVCTDWSENGNFTVHVTNPNIQSICNDLRVTSENIKKRIKWSSIENTGDNVSGLIFIESYKVKFFDTEVKFISELYQDVEFSVARNNPFTISAKNNYSEVSIAMSTELTYSKHNKMLPHIKFKTNSNIFIECFTRAFEISESREFEVHLLSDDPEYFKVSNIRFQFNMKQRMCFLVLDL